MRALLTWEARALVIESKDHEGGLSKWVESLDKHTAWIRDLLNEEMAQADHEEPCPDSDYSEGQSVPLCRPSRSQKCLPPYESGWRVVRVISPSTVVIATADDVSMKSKEVVNVEMIKPDVARDALLSTPLVQDEDDDGDVQDVEETDHYNALLDIKARGFWSRQHDAFFDGRLIRKHPSCPWTRPMSSSPATRP